MTSAVLQVHVPEDLLLVHSSMEYDDTPEQIRDDAREVLTDRPDVVSWTETEDAPVRPEVARASQDAGYLFRAGGPGGVSMSLHRRHELLEVVDVKVLNPKPAPFPHGERAVFGFTFRTPAGNQITYLTGHWTTLDRGLPKWNAMTEGMIRTVQRHADGRHIALWSGDLNRRDTGAPDVFTKAGLLTCWDDVGNYPDTYGKPDPGGPIDVVGRYDPDHRATFTHASVGRRRRRHADHRTVRAVLHIDPTKTL